MFGRIRCSFPRYTYGSNSIMCTLHFKMFAECATRENENAVKKRIVYGYVDDFQCWWIFRLLWIVENWMCEYVNWRCYLELPKRMIQRRWRENTEAKVEWMTMTCNHVLYAKLAIFPQYFDVFGPLLLRNWYTHCVGVYKKQWKIDLFEKKLFR